MDVTNPRDLRPFSGRTNASQDTAMEPIRCRYCGERVKVTSFSLPVRYREDAANELHGRQSVMYGDDYWLLHRCEIADDGGGGPGTGDQGLFCEGGVRRTVDP